MSNETNSAGKMALDDIEGFLRTIIEALLPDESNSGRGRPRVLPSLCLWAGLLVCVLRGFGSQLALWRLLRQKGLWSYPRFVVSDQAVYKRLAESGIEPLQQLFHQISDVLAQQLGATAISGLAPFASEVVALEQMTLDQVARYLPSLRKVPAGDDRLVPGDLAAVFDIRRQQWRQLRFVDDFHQNDRVIAREMVANLPPSTLLLADLGYFGFAWFDWLHDQGYYYVSRVRKKTSYTIRHIFYRQGDIFDGIIFLGAYRADQAAHAVRLVEFHVGKTTYRYITNVLDPRKLPIEQIARLYARRWDIELAFKLIKRHLNLHLLWSAKPIVIQQQLWAVLIISQILQALRMEVADRAHADPFEVSMELMIKYLPYFAYDNKDPIQSFIEQGRELRFIRPSTRVVTKAPIIPDQELLPLPGDVVLTRTPRYAQRKCTRRSDAITI